jgi:cation diffusion facilitator family transporter
MTVAVIVAFIANVLVAIAKTFAAVLTGSASLFAEAVHSWADAGNEVFLLIANRTSARERDPDHPLGYGREAYVWSLFAAVGVFTIGAVLSVLNGVRELLAPEPATDFPIGFIVLGASLVLESASLTQSIRQARKVDNRYRASRLDYVLNGSDTTLRAVILEDVAAIIGLLLAFAGLGLHAITANPVYDAIASILIGLLLAVVALLLIDRNRQYLVGASAPPRLREAVLQRLAVHPEIERITYLHLEFTGPRRLFLVAAVDLTGDEREELVARRLRRIEDELQQDEELDVAVLTLSTPEDQSLTT